MKRGWIISLWCVLALMLSLIHAPVMFSPEVRKASLWIAFGFNLYLALEVLSVAGIWFLRWWGAYINLFIFFTEGLGLIGNWFTGYSFKIALVHHGVGVLIIFLSHKRLRSGL